MKQTLRVWLGALFLLFVHGAAISQIDVSTITARVGFIRTLQSDEAAYSGHIWSVYPELQIGGKLFKPWLSWGVSWGYWTDGVDRAVPIADHVTYGESGHVLILRTGFKPQEAETHWPLPLEIFAGVAEHFQSRRYVGGTGFDGSSGISSSYRATTLYGGLGLLIRLDSIVQLETEVAQFIPLGSGDGEAMLKNRRDLKVGISLDI